MYLWLGVTFLFTAGAGFLIGQYAASPLVSIGLLVLAALLFAQLFFGRLHRSSDLRVQSLHDGIKSLLDRDYSLTLAGSDEDELDRAIKSYNELNRQLRVERMDLMQRELMLHSVIQSANVALVLTNSKEVVNYSNVTARKLFADGDKLEGQHLSTLCQNVSPTLAAMTRSQSDGLFDIVIDGHKEIFHLSRRRFVLNNIPNYLYLYKQLTKEFTRQEVDTWKKVIRVISHELNNSLAPIKSLCHTGSGFAEKTDQAERLKDIFSTISNRAEHLHQFIDQYAGFSRLPKPNIVPVKWHDFVANLQNFCEFRLDGELPEMLATFDPIQVEQVVINLVKNANESGSAPEAVRLHIEQSAADSWIRIEDSGTGLDDEQMEKALLPFYSTKRQGTGLGLPLCREIIEGHDGRLRLINKESGGLIAVVKLPVQRAITANT